MACSGYGTSLTPSSCVIVQAHNGALQARQLYVFDPLALSSIVVKDQYVYEQPPEFTT